MTKFFSKFHLMYQGINEKIITKSIKQSFKKVNADKILRKFLSKYFFQEENLYFFQSGRAALGYILQNIPKKKFVFVPSFTCEVVPIEVKKRGFTPIYYDLNPMDTNLSKLFKSNLNNVSAIIYQHSFGIHINISNLIKKLKKKKIYIIEDKALCFLSKSKKLPELQGDAAYYSFESSKTITCTMGGMAFIRKLKSLKKPIYKNNFFYNLRTDLRVLISLIFYKIPGTLGFAIRKIFLLTRIIKPSITRDDLNFSKNLSYYDLTKFQKLILINQIKNLKYLKRNSKKNLTFWSEVLKYNFKKLFKEEFLPLRLFIYSNKAVEINNVLKKNGLKQQTWFKGGVGDVDFNHSLINYKRNKFKSTVNFCENYTDLPSLINLQSEKRDKIKDDLIKIF